MSNPAPPAPLTTEQIQKMLEDNYTFIKAIVDQQNLGRLDAMAQYQDKLQINLMHLAGLADLHAQQGQPPLPSSSGAPAPAAAPVRPAAPIGNPALQLMQLQQMQQQLQQLQQQQQQQQAQAGGLGLANLQRQ